jgi:hypothetical protein
MLFFPFLIVGLTYVVHMAETEEKELALIWARLTYNPETSGQFIGLGHRMNALPRRNVIKWRLRVPVTDRKLATIF